jgi:hypothetical protein
VLIHLTQRVETLTAICDQGEILARSAFGAAYNAEPLAPSQMVACFSEMVALDSVGRLADRHGEFGLGFAKSLMKTRGAAPVWYLPRESMIQSEFFEIVRRLAFLQSPDLDEPLWRITPFIDYPAENEPGEASSSYDWRWEREWRIRGGLQFQSDDVALLLAPEGRHEWLADWWALHMIDGWGGYIPPIVSPRWPRDRQEEVIRHGPRVVELDLPVPEEGWEAMIDTAPQVDPNSEWDEDDRDLREELRDELNGWLDEMARDDI